MTDSLFPGDLSRFESELRGNILPFWREVALDRDHGGYYGRISSDLVIDNDAPRSAVVSARLLWTFSAAYRAFADPADLWAARHAFAYLTGPMWDAGFGGVFWLVGRDGVPVNERKHVYAQAFAIYALAEMVRAGIEEPALGIAQRLFRQVEAASADPEHGGNIECLGRSWGPLDDMRLSEHEPDCRKSMNTLLHLMEACTNLLRVWPDEGLRRKQRELVRAFLDHIIDLENGHLRLYFNDDWTPLEPVMASYGHDIEASWLLVEAAEGLDDPALLDEARRAALRIAAAVLAEGRMPDGAVRYESDPRSPRSREKHWWPQAEGLVGFYNAYQLGGGEAYARAALDCWRVIETQFVDRVHGDWFKVLDASGRPLPSAPKVDPWSCPYHHARACLEMLRRLGG